MRAGHIAGVEIRISPWFLLLLLLFAFAGMLVKVAGVFVSVLWHETAHVMAARLLGYRVREVELLPFGGVARIEHLGEASSQNDVFVALTGPVASFVMAAAIAVLSQYISNWDWQFFFQTNMMLGWFNLIPALPLDGGRILRAWLAQLCGYRKATRAAVRLSWLISGCFLAVAVLQFIHRSDVNITLLFAAAFIAMSARKELATAGFRSLRILSRKKADMMRCGVMPAAYYTAVADCPAQTVIALFQPERYHLILVVDQCFQLQGTLTETDIWERVTEKGMQAPIGDFL
ncbi:MAG: M50 family metallopeptidase [Sporomusaceae bacterium]|nr:M50 family metallopeptidase [Sporomusaceae bacterium]